MPASKAKTPGDPLRSQDNPLELAREFLQTATENALISTTPVVDAFEGQSVIRYPAIQEELLEGIEKFINGEDLPVLSAGPINKLAKVLSRNFEIGVPKGKSITELTPDLRLILKYLISPNVSEPGFAFSDILIKFNDTDNRDVFDLLLNSKPLLEAHEKLDKVFDHWNNKKPISRDMHQEFLGKLTELSSDLDKLAEDLEFNGALWLLFNNGKARSSGLKLGSFSGRNLKSFASEYLGSPLPSFEKAPSSTTGYRSMSVSELVLILMELKKWVESIIKSYKKNLKKDFEESDYRVLPDNMPLAAACFRALKDYRIFIEEKLKEED